MSNATLNATYTRRKFLGKTAQGSAAAMGVGMMSQMASGRKIGPNDLINTAIIGVGGQGLCHLRYQANANPNVRIAAACSGLTDG